MNVRYTVAVRRCYRFKPTVISANKKSVVLFCNHMDRDRPEALSWANNLLFKGPTELVF